MNEAVSRAGVIEIIIEGDACLQDKSNCLVKRVVTHITIIMLLPLCALYKKIEKTRGNLDCLIVSRDYADDNEI